MTKFEWLAIILVAALMASAGFWYASSRTTDERPAVVIAPSPNTVDVIGQSIPDFELLDIDSKTVHSDDFLGQIILYNFWASWCAPCIEEMPMLQEFHSDYSTKGFQVVGIAIDDLDNVRSFASELNISYPLLHGTEKTMGLNREFGNISGALPYSVLVDKGGIIRWRGWGILKHEQLQEWAETYL